MEQERLKEEEKNKKTKSAPKGRQQQEVVKQADSKKRNLSAGQKRGTGNVKAVGETAPPVEGSAELQPGEETFSVKHTLEFRSRSIGSLVPPDSWISL